MVVEWFIAIFSGLADWALGLFEFDEGTFLEEGGDTIGQVLANGAGLGAWVPWGFVIGAVGATFTLWLVGLVIKGVRWLVAWIPTMGTG